MSSNVGEVLASVWSVARGFNPLGKVETFASPGDPGVRVTAVRNPAALRAFVEFPLTLNANDPNYVAPLVHETLRRLDRAREPFWKHAEGQLFLAQRAGRVVGTIAVVDDPRRAKSLGRSVGTFGHFEAEDDQAVAEALLGAARAWLRGRNISRMEGPYNPAAGDEYGVLFEGFSSRPALMELHNPAYYDRLLTVAGMEKVRDAFAWLVKVPPGVRDAKKVLPEKLFEMADKVRAKGNAKTRPLEFANYEDDLRVAHELFNLSLAKAPGFVPVEWEAFRAQGAAMRELLSPGLARFVLVDGVPAGFALAIPDMNEALQKAHGWFTPWGVAKIYQQAKRLTRATFKILVIHPSYRKRGLETLLVADIAQALLDDGFSEADLSLTGEDNVPINMMLMALGLEIYRKYRVYGCDL